MSQLRMTWDGPAVKAGAEAGAVRGLATASEYLLQQARVEVPIQEGTLDRSGRAQVDEANLVAAVSFDTPYAVRQHEELGYRHERGNAKYLENPMNREADTMNALIAAQIRRALR